MIYTTIQSEKDKDKFYKVKLTFGGWECECFAYSKSKDNPKYCKHLPKAYEKLEKILAEPKKEKAKVFGYTTEPI